MASSGHKQVACQWFFIFLLAGHEVAEARRTHEAALVNVKRSGSSTTEEVPIHKIEAPPAAAAAAVEQHLLRLKESLADIRCRHRTADVDALRQYMSVEGLQQQIIDGLFLLVENGCKDGGIYDSESTTFMNDVYGARTTYERCVGASEDAAVALGDFSEHKLVGELKQQIVDRLEGAISLGFLWCSDDLRTKAAIAIRKIEEPAAAAADASVEQARVKAEAKAELKSKADAAIAQLDLQIKRLKKELDDDLMLQLSSDRKKEIADEILTKYQLKQLTLFDSDNAIRKVDSEFIAAL